MYNRNLARDILLRIEKLTRGKSIIVDDLVKEFTDLSSDEILPIISDFAVTGFIMVDGIYNFNAIEKYHKITGIGAFNYEGIDAIRSDKIWQMVENCLKEYNDVSIFTAINLAKKIVEKEFDNILKNEK